MNTFAAFRALLFAQWKQQRAELVVFTIVGAMIAPASLWRAMNGTVDVAPDRLLLASSNAGALAALLAIATGLLLALRPYMLDAQAGHTYALSLPVRRVVYALLRVGTGLTLALFPAAGFLVGALVASEALPPGTPLVAFPFGLTLHFLLATLLAFSIAFGIQYGLGRRAFRWMVLSAITIVGFELAGQLLLKRSVTDQFWIMLFSAPMSPLHVFFSRWGLFDV